MVSWPPEATRPLLGQLWRENVPQRGAMAFPYGGLPALPPKADIRRKAVLRGHEASDYQQQFTNE